MTYCADWDYGHKMRYMKIGILTFHWPSNYGAVLQCYALQQILKSMGHEVQVLNYKPWIYENNLYTIFRYRRILHPHRMKREKQKEQLFIPFRTKFLNLSKRFYRAKKLQLYSDQLDCIITGSDQVMNASFVKGGEPGGSTAYYLSFGRETLKRIAYAVSFGTTNFPSKLYPKLSPLVARFNAFSVREKSGKKIVEEMGRTGCIVAPDPTLLLPVEHYYPLLSKSETSNSICIYMLHNRAAFEKRLNEYLKGQPILYNNDCRVEDWLANIFNASAVVTNSFHGTVFSILFHRPFMVVLPTIENIGMNDRFYTLLEKLKLTDRITSESNTDYPVLNRPINWDEVDQLLNEYKQIGVDFLAKSLNN